MTKKQKALHFLELAARGDSREAFDKYVGEGFKHHNVYFKGDAETLMIAMEEAAKVQPNKIFEVKRALEDGDLVAVHSHFRLEANQPGYATMHIFRFEGDRVAELWDFGQEVPKDLINENGMF